MSIYVNLKYRIKRDAAQQELMQKLTSGNKIFESYRDILVWSAVVGYINNKYVPIEKPASDGVLMQFFTESDYDLIDLIAYAHQKEQAVLTNDIKYDIFSSYANGGFPILVNILEISGDTDIDTSMQETILNKMYAKILSDQFILDVKPSDLFI